MRGKITLITCLLLVLASEFDYSIITETVNFRHYALIILALVSILTPILIKKNYPSFSVTYPMKWMCVYYFYITLSLVWTKNISETPSALVGVFICILSCYIISNNYDYNYIIKILIKCISFAAILCWISYIFYEKYALNPEEFFRFKGVFTHSQRLSAILSVALIIISINKKVITNSKYRYAIIIIFIATILLTKTRAFTTFTLVVIVCNYIYSKKKYYLLGILGAVTFAVMFFDMTGSIAGMYQREDQDITELTGRSALWAILIPMIKEKLILGYGYGVFKEQSILVFSWYPTHAHNLWLHQLYETGVIGMVLFQLFLLSATLISIKHLRIFGYSYLFYILLFIFFCSFTGLIVGGLITPVYFILLLCTFCESIRIKNKNINIIFSKIRNNNVKLFEVAQGD